MTTYYVDIVGGNDANNGLSFAGRKKTLAAVSAATAGDSIRIMKSPDAYSLGQNAAFTNKSDVVNLTSELTKNIYQEGTWKAAVGGVICAASSTRKTGSSSASILLQPSVTIGRLAYFTTLETLDLSGFQQISFYLRSSVAINPNCFRIDLCSDLYGMQKVDFLTLNYSLQAQQWHVFTLNKGSALGSAIKSIALFGLSDVGPVTLLIDSVIACKSTTAPDVITLNHVIGKNDGEWWAIGGINGTTITLDTGGTNAESSLGRGFSGISESVECYARLPIKAINTVATAQTHIQRYAGSAGTSGNHVTISGGWDTATMSVQESDTLLDSLCENGIAWGDSNNRPFVDYSRLGAVRASSISAHTGNDVSWTDITIVNQGSGSAFTPGQRWSLDGVKLFGSAGVLTKATTSNQSGSSISNTVVKSSNAISSSPVVFGNVVTKGHSVINLIANNNAVSVDPAVIILGETLLVKDITANDNVAAILPPDSCYNLVASGNGVVFLTSISNPLPVRGQEGGNSTVYGVTTSNNNVTAQLTNASQITCYDANIGEANKVTVNAAQLGQLNLFRTPTDTDGHYTSKGSIKRQNLVVPPGMQYAWQYSPSHSSTVSADVALGRTEKVIARVNCLGGQNNTFQISCRRTSLNLACNLRVYGGRYPGIGNAGSDIVTQVDPSVDTWQDFSITVNPLEDCTVEIFFECYHDGTTTYSAYVSGPVVLF